MAEGNTEGVLVNEPKPATAGSNTNPAVDMDNIQNIPFIPVNSSLTPEQLKELNDELARRAHYDPAKLAGDVISSLPEVGRQWAKENWDNYKDYIHTALDLAAVIPFGGFIFDGINGIIYSAEGDTANAIASFSSVGISLIPGGKLAAVTTKGLLKLAEKTGVKSFEKIAVKSAEKKVAKSVVKKEDGIAVKNGKKNSVNNKECPAVGHPVNPVLGIKFLAGEPECDFTLSSYFSLIWQRRYFSDIAEDGWFGQGWTVSFSQRLIKRDDGLYFINKQGTEIRLPNLSAGQTKFDNYSQLYFSRETNNRYRIAFTGQQADLIFSPLDISEHDPQGHNSSCFPLTGMEDKYGNHIRLIYNQAGLPSTIRTATGQWLALTFITLTQPDGKILQRLQRISLCHSKTSQQPLITYCYSAEGDLSAVRDSSGKTQREFEYRNHILIQHGVPGGIISRYRYNEYSPVGKVLGFYTNLGQTWSFEYNIGSTIVTDPLDRKTRYQFDGNNELTTFTNAKGGITRYNRNKSGKLTSITLPDKTETACSYDLHGNITSLTNSAGKTRYIHYDDKNNPVTVINETGKITRYTYDNGNNVKSITNALNQSTEYIRNKRGMITAIKDPAGNVSTFVYNSEGLLTASRDCSGATTQYTLNHVGNITEMITPDGAVTRYTYAINGMVSAVFYPDNTSKHYSYNSQRQLTGYRDVNGEQTVLQFAHDGLPLTRTDPAGGILSCEYDPARRLTQLKNENGACYTFEYDENDNLIREQKFDGVIARYQYDAVNRLIKKYESGNGEEQNSGILTVFLRDKNGRITKKIITAADGKTKIINYYRYDDAGLLISAGNNDSQNDYIYDAAGKCITEISEVLGQKRTLQYRYDNNGNCINMTLPDKSIIDYLYYGSGHLIQINCGNDILCEFERDIMHREISRTQGCLTSYFSYNKTGRMLSQKVINPSDNNAVIPTLISRRYSYDEHGYLNRILNLSGTETDYHYDILGRLTASGHEQFRYDAAHNIVDPENIHGEAPVRDNHLKTLTGKDYRYDVYGNLHEKISGTQNHLTFFYTPEHRISRIEKKSAGKLHKTAYGYDVFGRRIYKKHAEKITTFLWDRNRLLAENNNECTTTYLYPSYGYTPVARKDTKKNPQQNTLYYYHTDQISTPREMTSVSGKCIWQSSFYAWGNTDKQSGELSQPLRFQGQYYDEESGLHYNRYRYYDPDIGRFITQDPIGLKGGINPYQYAPNPVNWVDPLGLMKMYGGVVYRALDSGQYIDSILGTNLMPKPDLHGNPVINNTIQDHVTSTENGSRYISTSFSEARARSYENPEFGCVRISLAHIPDERIIDLSHGHPGLQPTQNGWAIADREVLINGPIPAGTYTRI
ncbi:MAG: RHS repeat-associated core domain-containing protein [Morganella sp. (in: enterobacteria)]